MIKLLLVPRQHQSVHRQQIRMSASHLHAYARSPAIYWDGNNTICEIFSFHKNPRTINRRILFKFSFMFSSTCPAGTNGETFSLASLIMTAAAKPVATPIKNHVISYFFPPFSIPLF